MGEGVLASLFAGGRREGGRMQWDCKQLDNGRCGSRRLTPGLGN